jgi:D-threo-aldose 1-dehydrogenase
LSKVVIERIRRSRLGIGGATIGGMSAALPEAEGQAMVERAIELGLDYIDTAPYYGVGRSEQMVGNAIRASGKHPVLSTKVGRLLKPHYGEQGPRDGWANPLPFSVHYDYSYDGVMRSFADSQHRLGIAYIDVLLVHDIGERTHGANADFHWRALAEGGVRALNELKAAGHIGAIGLGVNEAQILSDAMQINDWDLFLLAGRYTLLEQEGMAAFLQSCIDRNVALVAGAPFNGGALMGSGTWNYSAAPPAIIERVKRIEAICAQFNVPVGAAALQFPSAHAAVASVLVGPRNVEQLEGLLAWVDTPIPAELWQALRDAGLIEPGIPTP